MQPRLKPYDLHIVFNASARRLKCFDVKGRLRWSIEARGYGAYGPGYEQRGGDTPPGLYRCGIPIEMDDPAFGPYWIDLEEMEQQEQSRGRAGIGIHGGGSGLADPFAGRQGWSATLGCIRVQNEDLMKRVVPSVHYAQRRRGTTWVTVIWATD